MFERGEAWARASWNAAPMTNDSEARPMWARIEDYCHDAVSVLNGLSHD